MATTQLKFRCQMHQLPINLNNATTGHKLQGVSKDIVKITSWPSGGLFRNLEYTVLSRVRTFKGLYLFKDISLDRSFAPSEELSAYFKREKISVHSKKDKKGEKYKTISFQTKYQVSTVSIEIMSCSRQTTIIKLVFNFQNISLQYLLLT